VRPVVLQFDVEQNLADEKIGAKLARQQHRVLADPAQPGALRQFAFEQRPRIDIHAAVAAGFLLQPA
jgi:hypothetical protein